MKAEKVIYSNLKIQSSSQLRRREVTGLSEPRRNACLEHLGGCAPLSSWKLTALVLLFISMGLFLALVILATQLARECSGNLTCSQEIDQQRLLSGNSKSQPSLTHVQAWKCHLCDPEWHQYGSNCYSFSKSLNAWRDCQVHCASSLSNFLIVDTKEELEFVKKLSEKTHSEKFWIGSHYNSSLLKWTWLDGSAFALDKGQLDKPDMDDNQCKYVAKGQLLSGDCKEHSFCICKKTADGA